MSKKYEITYKKLDKDSLLLSCDKDIHKNFIKSIKAVWNGSGWTVPKNKEKDIIKYNNTIKIKDLELNAKSRKEQNKYHREISEDEDDDDDSLSGDVSSDASSDVSDDSDKSNNESDIELDPRIIKLMEEKRSKENKKSKEKIIVDDIKPKEKYLKKDPMVYYKSFKAKPGDFKKINDISSSESEDFESSSSDSSSSDDSFPSPKTPKKRKKYSNTSNNKENYNDLIDQVKTLQRKMYKIEIENKKLKSKV